MIDKVVTLPVVRVERHSDHDERPADITGPIGFQHIDSAPRDGTFVRLRFRPGLSREDREEIGLWVESETMLGRGYWMDEDGYYITLGPLFWAPLIECGYAQHTGYRP